MDRNLVVSFSVHLSNMIKIFAESRICLTTFLKSELFRYGVVGVSRNIFGYTLYLTATFFGMPSKLAMTAVYVMGMTLGFWAKRKYIFFHDGNILAAGRRYITAHALGYLINLSILMVMVDELGYPHQLAQAAAILLVAAYLYLISKFYVFTSPRPYSREPRL